MDPVTIACVVEGHGETSATPTLVRRIAGELSIWQVNLPTLRVTKTKLLRARVLEDQVQAAAAYVSGPGGILVLFDADDDCPAELGPTLQNRAQAARPDKRVAVVVANREFEAWFLAAAPSIAGQRRLSETLAIPPDPEGVRGAKEWLSHHMTGASYKETLDQAALAAMFDIKISRQNSPSFDKFCREVERLLTGG